MKGAHTLKFGANLRFSRVGSEQQRQLVPHPAGQRLVGGWRRHHLHARRAVPGATRCGLRRTAGRRSEAASRPSATRSCPLLGIISETDAYYNYDRDGQRAAASGEPVARRFATDEYEFYAQDSWKIGQNLTVTAGLRYSLFSPPWETNGLQVAPDIKLGDWLEHARGS